MPRSVLLLFTALLSTGCPRQPPPGDLPEAFGEHPSAAAIDPAALEWCERYWTTRLHAWRLAREGCLQGIRDQLRVLGAQQTLLESERAFIDGRRQLLSLRLQACRALGHAPGV